MQLEPEEAVRSQREQVRALSDRGELDVTEQLATELLGIPMASDLSLSSVTLVVESLLDGLFDTARWYDAYSVGIAGGVSANSRLRADAAARGAARGIPVAVPGLSLSTDNAAMIAAAGLRRFRAGHVGTLDINADASLVLSAS